MDNLYSQLIPLVSYPEKGLLDAVKDIESSSLSKNINPEFNQFIHFINETELTDLQEKFTQTFDMNPATCLDLGWHLYGEAYERGAFMVKVRELLRDNQIEESSELPDHLTHVLSAIQVLDKDDQKSFIKKYVQPAMKKILAGFGESDNPYKQAIQFINGILAERVPENGGEA
ncbi:MAG: nitrate reductase molybdenum cofactor assembly chaperone [Candidatus Marinimicrobia bacterium]|nr:nitrate reductase molybdenum cofactor assembly chaperone [Candidatus Neomarinimicrobiota bacterium]